ncbi:MAG TPA: hypothetical protein VG407_17895 [Caulobacteraceae bacterium]|jgi:hypothetical protein|nr:hypothetical protein [Caulobacteraceae bacterium]
MSRTGLALVLLITAAPLAAAVAVAQDDPDALTQEFISPMGEPFRGKAADAYPVEAWFKGADAGAKGYLTKQDFEADAQRFFKALDTDGDGALGDQEIDAYENHLVPEIKSAMGPDPNAVHYNPSAIDLGQMNGEQPVTYRDSASRIDDDKAANQGKADRQADLARRRGAGVFGFFDEPEPVRAADTNIDFRISMKEWMEAADRRYAQLDKRHDGKVTRDELPATPFQTYMRRNKK